LTPIEDIKPPWVVYPGYPPGDGFWRQAGETWLTLVWRPYWESLSPEEQRGYLVRWHVPNEWRDYYFDADFVKWLDTVDD
jgi:hypothetical protein